jgi:SAM-dependent methyltransferase
MPYHVDLPQMTARLDIQHAYDGSEPSFRALRACGWGPLLNLGYYPLLHLPLLLGGLGHFQRRLARESLRLLDLRPGERILDACCGRGWTTAEIARRGARAVGLDCLPDNIAQARERYGGDPGVRFAVADVTRLPSRLPGVSFDGESFDRIHCLEAAFPFGVSGRREFLLESWRLLRPGGRLVLVDFVWRDDRPEQIATLDPEGLVRGTWQFEEFEPLQRYRENAQSCGFRERAMLDWSHAVTGRFVRVAHLLAWLGRHRPGRRLLGWVFPRMREVGDEHWPRLLELVRAHERVRRQSGYVALVLEKPDDGRSLAMDEVAGASSN